MEWTKAIMSSNQAKEIKEAFECGDIIGLHKLKGLCNNYDVTHLPKEVELLSHLSNIAIPFNCLIVDMEFNYLKYNKEFDDMYRRIIQEIIEYLDKIINQEVQ